MLVIIGAKATRTTRVLWALEELGVPYEYREHGPRSPEVVRLNPSGKVPVAVDGDTVLTDSTGILHHLADTHGCLTYPAGTLDRARQDGFTFRILDEIEGPLWASARHSFVLPEEQRLPAIKDSLRWEFGKSLERLAGELADGPFLMGDVMTVADIVFAHCLAWAGAARFPVPEANVIAYRDRLLSRPAAKTAFGA